MWEQLAAPPRRVLDEFDQALAQRLGCLVRLWYHKMHPPQSQTRTPTPTPTQHCHSTFASVVVVGATLRVLNFSTFCASMGALAPSCLPRNVPPCNIDNHQHKHLIVHTIPASPLVVASPASTCPTSTYRHEDECGHSRDVKLVRHLWHSLSLHLQEQEQRRPPSTVTTSWVGKVSRGESGTTHWRTFRNDTSGCALASCVTTISICPPRRLASWKSSQKNTHTRPGAALDSDLNWASDVTSTTPCAPAPATPPDPVAAPAPVDMVTGSHALASKAAQKHLATPAGT